MQPQETKFMPTTASLAHAQVLITGGGSGIGLGLAQRYLAAGARVCITGRNRERLEEVARAVPGLTFIVSDIADPDAREQLAGQVREVLPQLNVLINNAGVQRRVSLAAEDASWPAKQNEIDTLLSGPVHLTQLLIPLLLAHGEPAAIVNVTSGGAYVPQPFAPLYSACKAALHSYTVNLRHALQHTACRVIELIPPAINTPFATRCSRLCSMRREKKSISVRPLAKKSAKCVAMHTRCLRGCQDASTFRCSRRKVNPPRRNLLTPRYEALSARPDACAPASESTPTNPDR
jgi:uncharacterized oxidoreductase